jgi:Flp pilus assembly protein TadG
MQRRIPSLCQRTETTRRGAAVVEFAVVVPVFVTLMLGVIELGISIDASQKLHTTVRQAGRLAAMDFRERVSAGQTDNNKVIQDIRNHLKAEGLPGDEATISITYADGPNAGATFDLADTNNVLELFEISVEVPNSSITSLLPNPAQTKSASIVFRKGRMSTFD